FCVLFVAVFLFGSGLVVVFPLTLFFGVFLFVLGRLERDRAERLAEKAGAYGPGDGLAIIGPAEIIGADISEALDGNRRAHDVDGGSFAGDVGHGHQVKLVHDVRQRPLTVGTRNNIVRGNRFFGEVEALALDLEMSAAVGAVVADGNETSLRVDVDAVLLIGEMWAACAAGGNDQVRLAAVGGNPDEICIEGLATIETAIFAIVSIAAKEDDAGAIRRESGIAIHGERLRELLRLAAGSRNFPELTAFSGPAYEY